MVRLLRWGTFVVLLLVIVGAALSYPLMRERFFGPMLAAPAQTVAIEPTSLQADTAPPTTALAATVNATDTTFARPTMPVAQPTATIPALIIAAPSPTAATAAATTIVPSAQDAPTAAPLVIATTSLLPNAVDAAITPMVLGPSTSEPTAVKEIAESLARAVEQPNSTAATLAISPTDESSVTTASTNLTITPVVTVTVIAEVTTVTTTEATVTATTAAVIAADTTTVTTTVTTANVTPIVVTAIELTPRRITPQPVIPQPVTPELPTSTPQPVGPIANAISPLYSGPDFDAAIVGQTTVGQELTIVGLYTEGAWYLLVNGLWLPGAVVDNAPLAMPLVFPTMTPVPSPTPTVTFTPLPSATPTGSATPTPTATSLDEPVCDCSGDNLDCLGNIFANRAKAQQCFEYCFRQTGLDIHLLDPNLNGMACENLP